MFSLIINLKPVLRRIIIALIDLAIFLSSWLVSFYVCNSLNKWDESTIFILIISTAILGSMIYFFSGNYNGITRYLGSIIAYRICFHNSVILFVLLFLLNLLGLGVPSPGESFGFWLIINFGTVGFRFFIRDILMTLNSRISKKLPKVVIYGAGNSGFKLLSSLRFSKTHNVLYFVDDDPSLWGRKILEIPIISPKLLPQKRDQIDQILLSMPSVSLNRKRSIVANFKKENFTVFEIPSIEDITNRNVSIGNLKAIKIEDLLQRDEVLPDPKLLGRFIAGSVVCVTGAGGSIGLELCKQLINIKPSKIIMIENSEPNLYNLTEFLKTKVNKSIIFSPILGSTTNKNLIDKIFSENNIDFVFHSAAYKHVPLVEQNPISGIYNNVISTRVICNSAQKYKVKKVMLISTDKAVRPKSIMGASKRLAELIVQSYESTETCFSLVRFGNVLGSSGSVVPLFQKQIDNGGPITLTHPDIIRYFMTITEAAQLVIQASTISKGGDLFLLDMGNPRKVYDLAKQMIELNNLKLKDNLNKNGDIEISITGLRPGEKLYEELLIDSKAEKTLYPLIYRANEKFLSYKILWPSLDVLETSLERQDLSHSLEMLSKLVEEWEYKKDTKD